jgi:hypothetical protein
MRGLRGAPLYKSHLQFLLKLARVEENFSFSISVDYLASLLDIERACLYGWDEDEADRDCYRLGWLLSRISGFACYAVGSFQAVTAQRRCSILGQRSCSRNIEEGASAE